MAQADSTEARVASGVLRSSVLGDLSATPRVWVFMALTLLSAMAQGATTVSRVTVATETFDTSVGIGTMAILFGIAGVIMCLPSGMITDRFSARYVFLVSVLLLVVAQTRMTIVVAQGSVTMADLFANSVIEGALTGFIMASVVKVQASLVDQNARGSAEILNLLRMALGALIGTMVASNMRNPALSMGLAALTNALVAVGVFLVSRRTRTSLKGTRTGADLKIAMGAIRSRHSLQTIIVIDLILRLVIPTQLLTLFIADTKIVEFAGLLISLGIVGTLIGQFTLAVRGVNRSPERPALVAFIVAALIAGIGTIGVWYGWLLTIPLLLTLCILSYSALTAFCQGTVGALVQQRCPDEVRGRISAALTGVRNLFVTVAIAIGSLIMANWHLPGLAAVITGLMVLALATIRGVGWFKRTDTQ